MVGFGWWEGVDCVDYLDRWSLTGLIEFRNLRRFRIRTLVRPSVGGIAFAAEALESIHWFVIHLYFVVHYEDCHHWKARDARRP